MPARGEPLSGYQKKCPECGKEFWAYGDWSYTKTDRKTKSKIYYCSWGCLRKKEREEEKKDRKMTNIRSKCMVCGKAEVMNGFYFEITRDCICDECREAILYMKKFRKMLEGMKGS